MWEQGLSVRNYFNNFKLLIIAFFQDSDYRGAIGVFLFNHGDRDLIVNKGDRCAQLIFEKYLDDAILVLDGPLDETDRASGGFGSTGIADIVDGVQTEPLNLVIGRCDSIN
jgi:deoxyuridine 5'-triphosphate nucleotidohydrolase